MTFLEKYFEYISMLCYNKKYLFSIKVLYTFQYLKLNGEYVIAWKME